jgi:DNA-binding response OmpR family regulator
MSRRRRKRTSNGQQGRSNDQGRNRKAKSNGNQATESQKSNGKQSKANMVVLLDSDTDYVEMESRAVVNYISGYNPMGFTLAGKALNYIINPRNDGRIGLVILDIEMKDAEGNSVEEVLKFLARKRNIPIAAVSSNNTAENVRRLIELGGVGLLPKAFTMEIFVRFVKNILRLGRSTAWQCNKCGKLVIVDHIDMLKMKPIKCTDKDCDSVDLIELEFPSHAKS